MNPILKAFAPLALIAAVVGLSLWAIHLNFQEGYSAGFDKAHAEGNSALSDLKAKHTNELAAQALAAKRAADEASERLLSEVNRGNDLAKQLADKKAELRRTTENLNREITNVTTNYRRALDAQLEPLPPAVFTNGFVRVWN
ncbi:DNA-packaging protein, partial [Pseudomonas sp. HMWF031]